MLALCERFGKLPSEIYAEDAGFARMLKIEALVNEVRGYRDDGSDEIGHENYRG